MNTPLTTVGLLIQYLEQFDDATTVYVDMNYVNGGSFEHLLPVKQEDNDAVVFITDKGY